VPSQDQYEWTDGVYSGLLRPGPRPITFLHGLCGAAIHFDGAFDADCLEGRGLLALDLPGFGNSAKSDATGIEDQVAACRAVMSETGFEGGWLVAHSMASSAAARLGDGMAGVILLEGNLVAEDLEFSDWILGIPEDEFEAEFARLQATAEMNLRFKTRIADPALRRRYAETWRQCRPSTVRGVAAEINADTRAGTQIRLLAGRHRPVWLYSGDQRPAASVDHFRVRTIPAAGHFLMFDNPDAVYAAIGEDAI